MSPVKSSTYRLPLTTVPEAPAGVMVTLTTAVWPGLMTIGENEAAGLTACSQKSPVEDVTAGSNAFAVAVMARFAVPAGAPPGGYGPHSLGSATQIPAVMLPPGVKDPDGVVVQSDPGPGGALERSGSPA